MMQSGIFSKTFATRSVDENFALMARLGFQATQFNFASAGLPALPTQIPDLTLEQIGDARCRHGISLAAISATFNLTHPDAQVVDAGMQALDGIAAAAARLDCPLVTLCSGTLDAEDQWRYHPDNASPAAWRALIAAMARALTIADRHQISLGIEPELANIVSSAPLARRLLDELAHPRLKIIFDPANLFEREDAAQQRRIISDALTLLAPAVAIAHAKDRDRDGHFVTAGQGVLDYPWYVNALVQAGFDGSLIAHGLPAADAPAVATLLNQLIDPTGGRDA